jgi:hypothetical protein
MLGRRVTSQGFAAVRDFGPAYVGFGSISALLAEATRPFMSAMGSIATKVVRGSETSRCQSRPNALQKKSTIRSLSTQNQGRKPNERDEA